MLIGDNVRGCLILTLTEGPSDLGVGNDWWVVTHSLENSSCYRMAEIA